MPSSPPGTRLDPSSTVTGPARTVLGLVLLLPAVLALLIGYVWPSVRTLGQSFLRGSPLEGGREFVGLDNYQRAASSFETPLTPFSSALALALVPLLVMLVIAPALAIAAHYAGRPMRLAVRLALTLPMVCFAPVGLAMGWLTDRVEVGAGGLAVRAAVWFSLFGLACGVAVMFFLATLRRRRPGPSVGADRPARAGSPPWAVLAVVAGIAALTVLAVSIQAFTYPYLLYNPGEWEAVTPLMRMFEIGMQRLEFGAGHALATITLLPVMALGVGAALLAIFSGLRMEVDPRGHASGGPVGGAGTRPLAILVAAIGVLAVLAVTLYGVWPWLSRTGELAGADSSIAFSVLARTWIPPLFSTTIGVGLAAVAGFGIGALRPLGRWSELLLLPFAPWLFVAVGPLFLTKYESAVWGVFARDDTALARIIPVWLVVPALFLFTLLFRGLTHQAAVAERPAGYRRMVVTALPMLALVGAATYLVQAQSLLWGLLMTRAEGPAPVWMLNRAVPPMSGEAPFGLLLPLPMIAIFAAGLAVLQVFYLDRVAIRADRLE